jgi:hypothetical protein
MLHIPRIEKDLTGLKFGYWTILGLGERAKNGRIMWNCVCDCGKFGSVSTSHLNSGRSKRCRNCNGTEKHSEEYLKSKIGTKVKNRTIIGYVSKNKSYKLILSCDCGSESIYSPSVIENGYVPDKCKSCTSWEGSGEISLTYFSEIQRSAKGRNIVFDVNIEYLWDLFLSQNKKCIYSGVELNFYRDKNKSQSASLDRIDSRDGYIKYNVQWVHKRINVMKHNIPDKEFKDICCMVVKNCNLDIEDIQTTEFTKISYIKD